jgi:hypothetical protein
MGYDSSLRASDAERNEVADRLSRHFADGRLDQTEFKERLDTAMSATTRADLDGLFRDLPHLAVEPAPAPPRRRRSVPLLALILLLVVAASVSAATWPFVHVPWFLVFVAAFLIWHRAGRRHYHHL